MSAPDLNSISKTLKCGASCRLLKERSAYSKVRQIFHMKFCTFSFPLSKQLQEKPQGLESPR